MQDFPQPRLSEVFFSTLGQFVSVFVCRLSVTLEADPLVEVQENLKV